ncbi:Mobile element protein [Myxococcus hansupus]|uniref:Mobile element protein n=1 Tax=Pseudomyxococcus hansupus TaxID=1297742 RepID=A0A0H4X5V8_9BACT|nr:Mobile element protein [Myxococcus hansupus]
MMNQAKSAGLTSSENFSVDGSLIEAWASLKSFRPKDEKKEPPDDKGNPTVDFHGQKRSNTTHASTTDPEARLAYSLNGVMENRNGLLVDLASGLPWARARATTRRTSSPTAGAWE